MMLSKKMAKALNGQINAEMYSAYMYLGMSAYAADKGYNGVAGWMGAQAKEEMGHAMKIYGFVQSRGAKVELEAIAKPPANYTSVLDLYKKTLKHEQHVTGLINKLVDAAKAEKDHATEIFLQWFVTEQVEEEESVTDILGKLEMAGSHPGAIYMIDRELGARAAAGH